MECYLMWIGCAGRCVFSSLSKNAYNHHLIERKALQLKSVVEKPVSRIAHNLSSVFGWFFKTKYLHGKCNLHSIHFWFIKSHGIAFIFIRISNEHVIMFSYKSFQFLSFRFVRLRKLITFGFYVFFCFVFQWNSLDFTSLLHFSMRFFMNQAQQTEPLVYLSIHFLKNIISNCHQRKAIRCCLL